MQTLVFVGLLLATCTRADDLFGQRRDLLQFCHPQRSTEIGSSAIGALFIHPELGGMKVDYCLGLNIGCGKNAADKFCELKGMKFAESYIQWDRAGVACGGTRTLGSKEICEGECTGFRMISCAGSLVPDVLDNSLQSEEASAPGESDLLKAQDSSQNGKFPVDTKAPETTHEAPAVAPLPNVPEKDMDEAKKESTGEVVEENREKSTNGNKNESPVAPLEQGAPDSEEPVDPKTKAIGSTEGLKDGSGVQSDTAAKEDIPGSNFAAESSTESKETNAQNGEDDEILIDHPDLGDVILPGQEQPTRDEQPLDGPSETQDTLASGQGSDQQNEDVLCQERGSQSSIAAARNGCGSVISVCASNTAIAEAQNAQRVPSHDSVQGATGRRLTQQVANTEKCKTLFANECQAAAFDNANGLCAILMGSGPSVGEEKTGCSSAEQARDIFKKSVKESCDKFIAGAFP